MPTKNNLLKKVELVCQFIIPARLHEMLTESDNRGYSRISENLLFCDEKGLHFSSFGNLPITAKRIRNIIVSPKYKNKMKDKISATSDF